jgi:peroxiredoxin
LKGEQIKMSDTEYKVGDFVFTERGVGVVMQTTGIECLEDNVIVLEVLPHGDTENFSLQVSDQEIRKIRSVSEMKLNNFGLPVKMALYAAKMTALESKGNRVHVSASG